MLLVSDNIYDKQLLAYKCMDVLIEPYTLQTLNQLPTKSKRDDEG